jgi:flavin-dependent dehydrogenase
MSQNIRKVDVVVVGGSLSAAATSKRLVDAGLETVVIEKRKLPRHKICSGILSPRGHRFLIENFGPLPREVLHEPTSCRGVTFHFPSLRRLSMDFVEGPTPHLHRKFSDYWAIMQSGVEVHDETSFTDLSAENGHVDVKTVGKAGSHTYRARWVVAADGPTSPVVRRLYSNYPQRIPWFMVGQKFHRIKKCPLDPQYFHFWFHPHLGHYTWSHERDDRQIVGVGFDVGRNFHTEHQNVVDYLRANHGVELDAAEDHEGCGENFGLSLINRYVFGRGNVLVTGQAAGFLNMMAEGMSCALHSGAIAGEAVVAASRSAEDIQSIYRKMIMSEVKRCSDQWNPLKIAFGQPHEADFKSALRKLPVLERLGIVREVLDFMRIYGKFNWGRQMLGQAMHRLRSGEYQQSRWL